MFGIFGNLENVLKIKWYYKVKIEKVINVKLKYLKVKKSVRKDEKWFLFFLLISIIICLKSL